MSLRKVLENELRVRDYWTDLTLPLPADKVIEVAVKFLDHAIYQPRDVSSRLKWVMKKKKKRDRSEEHTSELQSPDHLVCRLLLAKQNSSELQSPDHIVCRLLLEEKTVVHEQTEHLLNPTMIINSRVSLTVRPNLTIAFNNTWYFP